MKIALLIIYNHRYDNNIPRLQKMYESRFDNIFHIVPFYDGNISNVIPVYENSYQFQGYIAQAYQHIKNQNFTHYYVIADDLILNPNVNKNNLLEKLAINDNECWLTELLIMQERKEPWSHTFNALNYNKLQTGG